MLAIIKTSSLDVNTQVQHVCEAPPGDTVLWCVAEGVCQNDTEKQGEAVIGLRKAEGEQEDGTH